MFMFGCDSFELVTSLQHAAMNNWARLRITRQEMILWCGSQACTLWSGNSHKCHKRPGFFGELGSSPGKAGRQCLVISFRKSSVATFTRFRCWMSGVYRFDFEVCQGECGTGLRVCVELLEQCTN